MSYLMGSDPFGPRRHSRHKPDQARYITARHTGYREAGCRRPALAMGSTDAPELPLDLSAAGGVPRRVFGMP